MLKPIILLLALAAVLTSCGPTGRAAGAGLTTELAANSVTSDDVNDPLNLTDYLQRVSGVRVVGHGPGAKVVVRGPVSFVGGQGILYVLNGSVLGYDYGTVFNAVNAREISRVRVLKNASEAAVYGVRGAGGVVEITLRQQ